MTTSHYKKVFTKEEINVSSNAYACWVNRGKTFKKDILRLTVTDDSDDSGEVIFCRVYETSKHITFADARRMLNYSFNEFISTKKAKKA